MPISENFMIENRVFLILLCDIAFFLFLIKVNSFILFIFYKKASKSRHLFLFQFHVHHVFEMFSFCLHFHSTEKL